MANTKILFLIHSLTGGGAERVTVALSGYLAARGYEAVLVTMTSSAQDFYVPGAGVRRMALDLAGQNRGLGKIFANLRRLRALRATLKRERPDVAVGMMTAGAVMLILAGLGLPVRTVASERNYPGAKAAALPWRLLRRLVYRFADAHVAQTDKAAEWLARHVGARNVHVIGNSVTWPVPATQPVVAPESLVAPERRVVLAVGTKPWQKGFDLLLDAFAEVGDRHPSWDLAIVGAPPETAEEGLPALAEMIAVRGLGERVVLPGRVGNVGDWYARADLFVLSSRYEGVPNVLLEAMAAGRACIAFDCDTGPRDLVADGEDGVLVPPEDATALGAAMGRLMRDKAARARLGAAAVGVRDRFSEERVLGRWLALIDALAAGRAP